jgi:hypothetical protein
LTTEQKLSDAHKRAAGALGQLALMLVRRRLSREKMLCMISDLRAAADALEEIAGNG